MKKLAIAAAIALLAAGCAHKPEPAKPQVNRAMKADKYAAPKKAAPVEAATPTEQIKKRWYHRFKTHPKWFSK
jgi:PBP1b-binding outer membrane lipoprotein LpoB